MASVRGATDGARWLDVPHAPRHRLASLSHEHQHHTHRYRCTRTHTTHTHTHPTPHPSTPIRTHEHPSEGIARGAVGTTLPAPTRGGLAVAQTDPGPRAAPSRKRVSTHVSTARAGEHCGGEFLR
eukprot:4078447-Prymnesium_polylepis.1